MEGTRGTIGHVVRQRRMSQGLSLDALATRAGCAKSYLSEIENERRPGPPRAPVLRRLEAALGLEAGSLVQMAAWAQTPGEVRERFREMESRDRVTRRLVELMNRGLSPGAGKREAALLGRSLDAAYKSGELRALIDAVSPEGEGARSDDMSRGPVERVLPLQVPLINAVAAGYPTEFTDLGYPARVADEYVRSPELADPDAFAARVVGESMLPDYREGDIVIFSPARVVKSGMDCFVRLERDHESTFKRIFFQHAEEMAFGEVVAERRREGGEEGEWIRLQPLNPRYGVRVVHREEVAGMYAAVSVTRALA